MYPKKLNLSILHWVCFWLIILKAKQIRVDSKNKKQDKYLVYNLQYSFAKFKNIDEFKELSFDTKYKRLNDFQKRFNMLKNVTPQTDKNKNLQEKVLNDIGDLFNELYYIYKDKYNEEKNSLKTKHTKKFDYKKLRFTDDYQYELEEGKEQNTSKKPDKKNHLKNQQKLIWVNLINGLIKK